MNSILEYQYICKGFRHERKDVLPKIIVLVYLGKAPTKQTIKLSQVAFTFFSLPGSEIPSDRNEQGNSVQWCQNMYICICVCVFCYPGLM